MWLPACKRICTPRTIWPAPSAASCSLRISIWNCRSFLKPAGVLMVNFESSSSRLMSMIFLMDNAMTLPFALRPSGAPENPSRGVGIEPPDVHHHAAVHDHVRDSTGIAVRVLERRFIANALRVEQRQIGEIILPDEPAPAQAELRRRLPGHLGDRLLVREQPRLPHVLAENAGERAAHARMRAPGVRTVAAR